MAAIGMGSGVRVICKQCGKPATASEFILDSYFKKMVCPTCYKDRINGKTAAQKEQKKAEQQEEKVKEIKKRPAGWDEDDEYLERMARAKREQITVVTRIDQNRVKYVCKKCGYGFAYNTFTKMPRVCQYCAMPVNTNFEIE